MKVQCCYSAAIIQAVLLTIASPVACAQDTAKDGYVTRKEYEELKAQLLAMKKELDALRKERAVTPKLKARALRTYTSKSFQRKRTSKATRAKICTRESVQMSFLRLRNWKHHCLGRPNSSLPVGRRICLRRATVKSLRFRRLLIQSFFGN